MGGITTIATIALGIISQKANELMTGNFDTSSIKSLPGASSNGGGDSRSGIGCLFDDSEMMKKNKSKIGSIKSEIREKKKKQGSTELSSLDIIYYTNQLVDLGCGLDTIRNIVNAQPY